MSLSPTRRIGEQVVTVATVDGVVLMIPGTVTFAGDDGGYDDVEATAMFTIVENDAAAPMNVKATAGGTFAAPTITVTWDAPDTIAQGACPYARALPRIQMLLRKIVVGTIPPWLSGATRSSFRESRGSGNPQSTLPVTDSQILQV